ncbi:uncharacterized protein CBL_03632 [Carabus blaptoides fortunei]
MDKIKMDNAAYVQDSDTSPKETIIIYFDNSKFNQSIDFRLNRARPNAKWDETYKCKRKDYAVHKHQVCSEQHSSRIMDTYVKSVIFALIFVLMAWNVKCAIPPQGQTVTIHKLAGSASLSLIQQESNLPPIQAAQQPVNQIPSRSANAASPTGLPQPNRGNTPTNLPQNTRNPSPNVQSSSSQSAGNRGNVRDYVNPNTASGVPTNRPTSSGNSPPSRIGQPNSSSNTGVRDYVNPSVSVGQKPNQPAGTISYANAASGNSANVPRPNTNVRDYVAPQRSGGGEAVTVRPKLDFPSLPNANGPKPNPSTNTGVTLLSYAQKLSGGATTKSPLSIPKQSPPGPPGSTTTPKPDDGPTDIELKDFSEALLRRDVNNAAKYVTANIQGKTTSQSKNDEAPQKLLEIRSEAYEIPTIAKLKLLHNNYILDVNENEHVTAQERAEENELLDTMLTTPIMQYTKNFLISKGKLSKDPKDFKDLLKSLWFNMYSRAGGKISSSGFEHIFLAELKKNEVSGLHNWIYFDQAEITQLADYLGYMKKIDLGEKGSILKFHFKLNGVDKPVDSMFIGTSPELEMALYTTCYMFRANRICPLKLNGNHFIVRTYSIRYRGKNMIGSAFPEI